MALQQGFSRPPLFSPTTTKKPHNFMAGTITGASKEAILNVTASSIAQLSGVEDGEFSQLSETEQSVLLNGQIGLVQREPKNIQAAIHNELAEKYAPELAEKLKTDTVLHSPAATVLNVVSYTPYFVRFLSTKAGKDITSTFASHVASLTDQDAALLTQTQVAEIGQFLSTLIVLQGRDKVSSEDKRALTARFEGWEKTHKRTFAATTSERCISTLEGSRELQPMLDQIKDNLQAPLKKCGGPDCQSQIQQDSPLLKCSRCKSAVYCNTVHQKQAWKQHKQTCFVASF